MTANPYFRFPPLWRLRLSLTRRDWVINSRPSPNSLMTCFRAPSRCSSFKPYAVALRAQSRPRIRSRSNFFEQSSHRPRSPRRLNTSHPAHSPSCSPDSFAVSSVMSFFVTYVPDFRHSNRHASRYSALRSGVNPPAVGRKQERVRDCISAFFMQQYHKSHRSRMFLAASRYSDRQGPCGRKLGGVLCNDGYCV